MKLFVANMFGKATAQRRCQTLCSFKVNCKKIHGWKARGHMPSAGDASMGQSYKYAMRPPKPGAPVYHYGVLTYASSEKKISKIGAREI